ncbi:long-chain fatty acid--CoA ligase [Alkalihalobacillus sp. LMS6]|uniref:long-chain-fatty-acid--CoA ligase n=1 Tax=Bacillaceae TaxID=186817 RepID=UPI000C081B69|nr:MULTISPECIES: long-chain fatty acid--CoA ligase [Bacillaceae]UTR05236.1 long-chain fatty acid--CoA ligase [Alkalihalobacillus sp. LMS6]
METVEKRWTKHYPTSVKESINYDKHPLQYFFTESAKKYPEHEAVHFLGKSMTYEDLHNEALRFANQLVKLGVKKGDRVAVMLPNSPQSIISYYGILMAGGIVVQVNPLYVERELQHQLSDSGAKLILCLNSVLPRVQKVMDQTPVELVIVTGIPDYLPFPKGLLFPLVQKKQGIPKVKVEYSERILSFTKLIKEGKAEDPNVSVSSSDLALLQYTGGTTGLAKGVMLTHYNLVVNAQQCDAWLYKAEPGKERVLGVMPFFHVYGMTTVMNVAVMKSQTMVLLPRFNPKDVLKTIEKQKVTLFPGAPTMYIALCKQDDIGEYDLTSVNACISGAAALPQEVQQKFEKLTNGRIVEGYGLTETSPVACANPIWDKRKPGSVGIPWPDTEIMIYSAEKDGPAETGDIGEVFIKGPQVMTGYWNRPEDTSQTFHGDWFKSGDMGKMDEDGYVYIVDRKKELIIASGYNIYPREIEEVLYEHEEVVQAAVVGVPDEYRGETVKAFVVLKEGSTMTEADLKAYCAKRMAAFKLPKLYEFRSELPATLTGKILKRVLLDEERTKEDSQKKKQA